MSTIKANPAAEKAFTQSNEALDDGARILCTVVRPYPAKTAGVPIGWTYEFLSGQAEYEWQVLDKEDCRCRETVIFYPSALLAGNRTLELEGLASDEWKYDPEVQTIFIVPSGTAPKDEKYHIRIRLNPPLEPLFIMTTHWQDFAGWYAAMAAIILGLVFFSYT